MGIKEIEATSFTTYESDVSYSYVACFGNKAWLNAPTPRWPTYLVSTRRESWEFDNMPDAMEKIEELCS